MNIQQGKDSFFNKWCWENWTATGKGSNLFTFSYHIQKQIQNWIKDLNVRPQTNKLLGENGQYAL